MRPTRSHKQNYLLTIFLVRPKSTTKIANSSSTVPRHRSLCARVLAVGCRSNWLTREVQIISALKWAASHRAHRRTQTSKAN